MAHDIFISHSSADAPAAQAIVNALESRGIRCWIAPRDIQGGQIWAEAIMAGIAGARALVVVFSSNANRSAHVLTEVDTAVRQGAVIVPFRIEAVDPEGALAYHLRTRHWLDALTPELERHIGQLVETLDRLLATDSGREGPSSRPWLRTAPAPSSPAPSSAPRPAAAPRRRLARPLVAGLAVAGLLGLGAGLLWVDGRQGRFVIRDASGTGEPVSLPVRVTGVRFFEGPRDMPPTAERSHAARFAAGATRYIYTQVDMDHGNPPREIRFPLTCSILDEEGGLVGTLNATGRIQPDWSGSNWASGYGNPDATFWKPGQFEVACSYAGHPVARGRFEVVGGGTPPPPAAPATERLDPRLPEIEGRIAGLRFFPDFTGPITPLPERKYTTAFSARELLYLGIELRVEHPPLGRRVSLTGACRINAEGGRQIGSVDLSIAPEPDWEGSYVARSYGWPEAGRWSPGRYDVTCRVAGRLVARGAVTVR